MGANDIIYGLNILSFAHCWNLIFNIPLAPVIIFAVFIPDCAKFIMAFHACSSVKQCKSKTQCCGTSFCFGIRVDRCSSARTVRATSAPGWLISFFIICSISQSVNRRILFHNHYHCVAQNTVPEHISRLHFINNYVVVLVRTFNDLNRIVKHWI